MSHATASAANPLRRVARALPRRFGWWLNVLLRILGLAAIAGIALSSDFLR